MSLKLHVQTICLSFCSLFVHTRKKMRTAPYSRKKELGSRVHREKEKNKQKKEGRERKRERESKDERDRKRSFWAIEMLIRFARFLGFFVLFCEYRSSAYDLLECVVRLAEERWARFLAKRTCRIIEAFFHVYSRNKTIHLKKKRS